MRLPLLFVALVMPLQALAYLDPGSGSMMLQLLIAGIVGLVMTVKLYWQRIVRAVSRRPLTPTNPLPQSDDSPR